ncbi:DUF6708 domain-containing protein [Pseudomonas cremoricolorata]|uniref:DUF6708 domain-containing protein n=1 Tax=Pseudomonas cremoricolorata TaxID=157783 RepID=UPI00048B0B39|nr:DUF6708 domain-containing protein [Pseudomonas cremoricolorata]
MAISWLFRSSTPSPHTPAIVGQLLKLDGITLHLRNPILTDSVFMGKMHCAMTLLLAAGLYSNLTTESILRNFSYAPELIIFKLLMPYMLIPFLLYEVWLIKRLSNICFNRSTQKIYYQRFSQVLVFDWKNTAGGLFMRREFGGSSFSTSYALAFAPYSEDGTLHQKDALWIDSNEPTESDIQYVAEVWEYLRQFMDHGPDNLPPPGPANWWHKPLHAICLTPAEAWRHYAPWRTGEPGEMQGKRNWQLPFWAVLFPYNLTVAICWYGVCKLFDVRAAPPPAEALQEGSVQPDGREGKGGRRG